jgi:hypothetical protein
LFEENLLKSHIISDEKGPIFSRPFHIIGLFHLN